MQQRTRIPCVLSLNGGGMAGFGSASFLARMESNLGPLHESFHLIAGVSTGSILAAGLGLGIPAERIAKFYRDYGPEIFRPHGFWRGLFAQSKYDIGRLRKALREVFGDAHLSDMKTKVMFHACRIFDVVEEKPVVEFFKSWHDGYDHRVADVVTLSCAAPYYFRSVYYRGAYYIDGGLAANNPAMCAYAETLRLFDRHPEQTPPYFLMVRPAHSALDGIAPKDMGSLRSWATRLPSTFLEMGDAVAAYQMNMLDKAGLTVSRMVDVDSGAMDDTSAAALHTMEVEAYDAWREHGASINRAIQDRE